MRIVLVLIIMMVAAVVKAQAVLPGSFIDYTYRGTFAHNIPLQDSSSKKKWSFSKYTGLSASYSFFKGGSASVIAAPLGLQINRQLTNNVYAFAGVSVAPAYINFNNAFLPSGFNKTTANNTLLRSNNFGLYSRAEVGLMYVNPEKTFSVSGSIGIERSSSPVFYYPTNAIRQNNIVSPYKGMLP
ncbi:hypothetical protein FC093_15675 [Ilyomonas limi]|uniref:Uncharacterized protein n=1 Tax=Ilyomonas limi TaxID=2575867 RepID=A0A4U3KYI6_9BACT|nr:hypothetical protein [Ilyomonas limi]TKK66939.1 hypothetical protein FC093_15675 [Ilyomonas limi]